MFKSSPTLKPSSPLRSSDRRKFIQNLQALYPSFKDASIVDVELIQTLVPEGLRQANTTTSAGYKAILYSHPNGTPLWFSFSTGPESGLLQNQNGTTSGKNNSKGKGNGNGNAEIESTPKVEIIPTVYTLWLFPSLLPRVNTWNKVVQVCLGGSSLMAPGLLPEPHTFHSSSTSTSISQSNGKDSIHSEEAESQSEEVSSYQPSEDYLSIQPGSLISIVSYPSSIPLIVAKSELSHQEMSEMKIKGGKGKAARIIHCYKDHLWSITKKDPKDLEEIYGDKEAGLITQMGRLQVVSGEEWKRSGNEEKKNELEVETEIGESSEPNKNSVPINMTSESNSSASSEGGIESLNHIQDGEFNPSEVEEILKLSFLQTLSSTTFRNQATSESSSNTNSSSFFPLSSSTFYSTFLLPSRPITFPPIVIRPLKNPKSKPSFPPGTKFDQRKVGKEVDIKKSSSKKLAKFLKGLEKDGWIKTKERSGEDLILEVNFEHQDLKSFQPFLTISQYNEFFSPSSEASTKDPSNPTSSNTNPESFLTSTICKVSVDEFWSPSKATKAIFDEVGTSSDPTSLYTRSALRTVIQRYINSKQLSVPSNMAFVRPDDLLKDCLWSSSKSKSNDSQSIPSEVKREELIEKMIKSCTSSHRINKLSPKNSTLLSEIEPTNSSSDSKDLSIPLNLRSPQDQLQLSSSESVGTIRKGDYSPILLSLKLRQGRKIVTLLTRLEDHGLDVKEISTEIMRAVGASTSLNELPGSNPKNQKWELLIQGDQRKFLLEGSNAFLRGKGIDVKRQVKVEDVKK